ncbi:MAG TPA: FTR1 family protein [Verrucomicrobiae bacterium]|nr:FTR1 family protein [Verrucomicrobiae bacterium]
MLELLPGSTPSAVVVFREVLEAALVVGIVMAATRGIRGRGAWILAGIGSGVIGACLVALFAEAIRSAASGMGSELFNAIVLFLAVLMLGWHCVWMSRHGREIAQQMTAVGRAVAEGARPLYALSFVIALAVLREGSEIVLFLYGFAAGGQVSLPALALGSAIGLGGGIALGLAIYLGLLRVPMRHLFAVTTWMIILLAAGMAAQGAAFLVQADLLPALGKGIWDTSKILSEKQLVGQILHVLVGYDSRPSGIQIVFYLVTIGIIGFLTWRLKSPAAPAGSAPRPA